MGTVMLKPLLMAPVRLVAEAMRVYPLPALSILKFAKVATPLTAATVVVPEGVPLAGLVPIATAMLLVADVLKFDHPPTELHLHARQIAGPPATEPADLVNAGASARPNLVPELASALG